jgi:SAM-dependent methyltransferase
MTARAREYILDLGSGAGSALTLDPAALVVALDRDPGAFVAPGKSLRVIAEGGAMPFAAGSFDRVICHHALEHIENPDATLAEIGRVLTPNGRLYISVPDGYSLSDNLYRWIFEGGEHVNRFRKDDLIARVERATGARLIQWQKLYSSFAYLARLQDLSAEVRPTLAPRLRRIASLPQPLIAMIQGALYMGTRVCGAALYGWALYFDRGHTGDATEIPPFVNVCFYCGAGHPSASLKRRAGIFTRCPACNHRGLYFPPL